jgi:hypothetical protein
MIDQIDATYKMSARMATVAGARTGLFVQERGALFVAVPQRGKQGRKFGDTK